MKIDSIVKQEMLRSIAVYFFFFFLFNALYYKGYISFEPGITLILAFLVTIVHFWLMVWYRRKEQLLNPSIFSIINYVLRSESYEEKNKEPNKNEKTSIFSSIRKNILLLIITIFLYIIYLYASLAYNVDQIFWILILLFIGGTLSKILYSGEKENKDDPMRLLIFYVIACVFIFVRYLVLGYPIFPILKGSIILGILLVFLVFGIKWSQRKQNSDD
ncbi:MAG: hypothetical protein ACPK85_08540 [Methanosarcina sp.]